MSKKLYIKTYGCQMNVYDSQKMAALLKLLQYDQFDDFVGADMVILNTCHIREKAAEKVYSELGRIRQEKERRAQEGAKMLIVVSGCVAQAEGHEIFARAPFVDIVVGPQSYHKLPGLINKANNGARQSSLINLDFPEIDKFDSLPLNSKAANSNLSSSPSAFLSIQEGCDKFCTFCVVPYTRGAEYSRSANAVYREALALVSSGAKEIVLLGQNVNAYHGKGMDGEVWNLADLIKHLAKVRGLERIRYTTSHPLDMSDDLIELHGIEEKLMPFLHLPVQSGSDKILKAMNRKHDSDYYRRVIDKLRSARKDMAFSSDFIVGFPGETDEDFKATMKLVEDVGYASSYSFKYSERPGTPAADKKNQVPEEEKAVRLSELQQLIRKQQDEFNKNSVDSVMPVLFTEKGRHEGQIVGKTPYMQSVHVNAGNSYIGKIMDVEIIESLANSLAGKILDQRTIERISTEEKTNHNLYNQTNNNQGRVGA